MSKKPRLNLYQVAVLHHSDQDGTTEVVKPTTVLATDVEHARLKVVRLVSDEWDDRLDGLDVKIQLF